MNDASHALVEKQVGRVRLRLFLQVAVQSVLLAWAIGLLFTMAWFLLRPFVFAEFGDVVRWSVPAIWLGLSTLAGLAAAWIRRPDAITSSLALDDRFGLQERVTTFLTLSHAQIATPAGQALLKDVTAHLATLQLVGAFPVRIPIKHLLVPAGAFVLALVACLLDPLLGDLNFGSTTSAEEPRRNVDVVKMQDELEKLKKNVAQRNLEQTPKSEDLKKLEQDFEKLLNQPLDGKNEEKIKERIAEFRKLEDKMKERLQGLKEKTEKIDALKKQLEKLGLAKDKLTKEGPAKDFEDALMKGDFNKAKAALQKLVKDLKDGKLDAKQQKELAEQFKKLQDNLKKVMDEDDFLNKLKKDLKDGKINKEDLDRELEKFKHLQDLANIIGECEKCLGRAAGMEGAENLDKLLKGIDGIELTEAELRDLLRDQEELDDALRFLQDGMDGEGGEGGGPPGGRRRADPNDPNSKIRQERTQTKVDPKGVQGVTGYARGGTFSKIPAQSVEGAFRQAAQEAPEALDRQRIPEDAAPITREYFKNLGNQK